MNETSTAAIDTAPRMGAPSSGVSSTMSLTEKQERCLHCGLAADGPFCCSGCEAVHATLHELGLTEFYRWRDTEKVRPIAEVAPDPICDELPAPEPTDGPVASYTFELAGIHCAGCLWLLEKLPRVQPGLIRSSLNVSTGELTVLFRPAELSLRTIVRLLVRLGYPPRTQAARELARPGQTKALARIGVAGFVAMNTMMLAVSLFEGLFTGIDPLSAGVFRWVSLGLSIPAVLWAGLPLYEHALKALRLGRIHIELPLTIAIAAAFVLSAANTAMGRPYVYFDSVCLLVFLLLVSRYVQERAVRAARRGARIGWSLLPATVRVDTEDGRRTVLIEELVVGDKVIAGPGERVPADGVVEQGTSSVDCSIMTGESRPEEVSEGSFVSAGSLNTASELSIRVTQVGESTRIGTLLAELRRRSGDSGDLHRFTDAVGRWYLVGLASAAVLTLVVNGTDARTAIEAVFTLFIVTCPCALAFAVPTLFGLTIGEAARRGILVKSTRVLEELATIRRVYVDKTGTLTHGAYRVKREQWNVSDRCECDTVLAVLTSLQPEHPISRAIRESRPASSARPGSSLHIPGRGVELVEGDCTWRLGSPEWAAEGWSGRIDPGDSVAVFSKNRVVLAEFQLGDEIRASSRESLEYLSSSGRSLSILSGDRAETVEAIGRSLGVPGSNCRGALAPDEKAAVVSNGNGASVFVGDGVNDILAIRAADVGIALAGGLAATVEVADVVFASGSLEQLVDLWKAAKRTRRVVLASLAVSLVYNVAAAGLAILGRMNPLIAAFLMPTSSLSVMGLSLLYRPFGRGERRCR